MASLNLDGKAIFKAYPEVVTLNQLTGCFTEDGTKVELDDAKVAAARAELDLLKYKDQRKEEYPDWGTQLDYIYHNGIDKWKTDIVDPVKAKYPKPS